MPSPDPGRRLIFVNRYFHPDESATAQMLSDLAFELAALGHRVEVITGRHRYRSPDAPMPVHEFVRGVEVHRVDGTGLGRDGIVGRALDDLAFMLAARRKVAARADGHSIVIAKSDPPMLAWSVTAGAVRAGARVVHWVQDLFPEVAERARVPLMSAGVGALLRRLRNAALAEADVIAVVGEGMAQRVRALGVARQLCFIPNWSDGRRIRPAVFGGGELRPRSGASDDFVVGYSGNVGRVHEFTTLVAAASILSREPRVRFLVVGRGARWRKLREEMSRAAPETTVFEDPVGVDRLGESLACADVHLCTLDPRFEGLVVPSKVYGIMAAGRPCIFIGDPGGEVARLVDRGGFGLVVRAGDGAGLAKAIRRLGADPLERAAMGAAGRELFEREFDLPIAVARWSRLIESVQSPRGDEIGARHGKVRV